MKFEDAMKYYLIGYDVRVLSGFFYQSFDHNADKIVLHRSEMMSKEWEVFLFDKWTKETAVVDFYSKSSPHEIDTQNLKGQLSVLSGNIKNLQLNSVSIADYDHMRGQISDLFGKFKHLQTQFSTFVDNLLVRVDKIENQLANKLNKPVTHDWNQEFVDELLKRIDNRLKK